MTDKMVRVTRGPCVFAVVGSLLCVSVAHGDGARSEGTSAPSPESAPKEAESAPRRRSGFTLGLEIGGGIGEGTGYPNDSKKIGDGAYHNGSGVMGGHVEKLLVMGAIADAVNFGFWAGGGAFDNSRFKSSVFGVGVRVEGFPLYGVSRGLRDLGLSADFGVGSATLEPKSGYPEKSEGTQSFVGLGCFYEWRVARLLGGHLGMGPSTQFGFVTSHPMNHYFVTLGLRTAFYGGG